MNDSLSFVNSHVSSTLDFTNIIFGLIGVIGTIGTLFSLFLYLKFRKENNFIFKTVKSAINKEETEKKLSEIKSKVNDKEVEIKNLSDNIILLQKKIRHELPIEAKKAVLNDRLEDALIDLHVNYSEIKSTREKLQTLGINNDIPEEIKKYIEHEIQPKYLIRNTLAKQKTYLTIQTSVAAIVSAIIPGGVGNILALIIMGLSIPILAEIFKNTKISEGVDKDTVSRQFRIWKFLGLSLISIIISSYLLVFGLFVKECIFVRERYNCEQEKFVFIISGLVLLSFGIALFIRNWRRLKKLNKTEVVFNN
jgi:hypothetical protein